MTALLAFAGDVMLGRTVNEFIQRFGAEYVWGNTLKTLRKADLFFINLECCISAYKVPWIKTPKTFHFRAEPNAMECLKAAKVSFCSLANNHILDFNAPALLETTKLLKENKIAFAGAGKNIQEAKKAALLKTKNLSIATVAFTDNNPEFLAKKHFPGTWFLNIPASEKELLKIKKIIKKLKEKHNLVVVSIHWGPNMTRKVFPGHKKLAYALIDAGADLIHGHSAHLFKAIEIYKQKPIFYDCGDFVDDYAVDEIEKNNESFVFFVHIKNRKIKKIELFPVKISRCQVNIAGESEARAINGKMVKLCKEFNTHIKETKNKLTISI